MDRFDEGIALDPAAGTASYELMTPRDWIAVATGLNLSFALCTFLCKAPEGASRHPLAIRLLLAVIYPGVACGLGAIGTWIMLPAPRARFRILARCGLRAWVFLPAVVLLLREQSIWASPLAMIAASLLALSLCHLTTVMREETTERRLVPALFETEVHSTLVSANSLVVSLCVYGAVFEMTAGHPMPATVLLAATAFLLVLQRMAASIERRRAQDRVPRHGSHPYALTSMAFLCVLLALSGFFHGSSTPLFTMAHAATHTAAANARCSECSAAGYQTIVLWPPKREEKTIPAPSSLSHTAGMAHRSKPWTIPFDGPYWYFKSAGDTPGPNARTAHGDPLKVNIRSTDQRPLLMEAHQRLAEPLGIDCCRELQVVLRNDQSLQAIAVGLTLTDTRSRRSQSLGVQAIGESAVGSTSTGPIEATVSFRLPRRSNLKEFDALTITLLPDPRHRTAGRKTAVERFIIVPN